MKKNMKFVKNFPSNHLGQSGTQLSTQKTFIYLNVMVLPEGRILLQLESLSRQAARDDLQIYVPTHICCLWIRHGLVKPNPSGSAPWFDDGRHFRRPESKRGHSRRSGIRERLGFGSGDGERQRKMGENLNMTAESWILYRTDDRDEVKWTVDTRRIQISRPFGLERSP